MCCTCSLNELGCIKSLTCLYLLFNPRKDFLIEHYTGARILFLDGWSKKLILKKVIMCDKSRSRWSLFWGKIGEMASVPLCYCLLLALSSYEGYTLNAFHPGLTKCPLSHTMQQLLSLGVDSWYWRGIKFDDNSPVSVDRSLILRWQDGGRGKNVIVWGDSGKMVFSFALEPWFSRFFLSYDNYSFLWLLSQKKSCLGPACCVLYLRSGHSFHIYQVSEPGTS